MKIFNTLSGIKEEFIPLSPNKVGIYACGVTVYDDCHIGHARSAIVFDVIKRYFRYKGFNVKYVRNFTDIDDKIIKRANQEGVTWDVIAKKYIEEYYKDMDMLGVERADVEPKATEHISEMIEIIKVLIEKDYAYEVEGNVYFSVERFPEYGKLSKRNRDEMIAGLRVEIDERKRSPLDFALWKSSKEGEPFWESPWGRGRPGWHIECTAMSIKHLGETFDIHGGGADLLFPHHENEIAQSEAYTGNPFARYWIHNGFITIDKEKMSKSLGNFFTIKEVLKKFDAEVVRLFLLSTHYRSPIEFSDEQLRETEISLNRYYSTVIRIQEFLKKEFSNKDGLSEAGMALKAYIASFKSNFEKAMDDDFNTALALGYIFELIRETNRFLDRNPFRIQDRELILKILDLFSEIGEIFNIFKKDPREWYISLMKSKNIELTEEKILEKIKVRQEARKNKNWELADSIRKELEEKGIILEDKKDRTDWKVRV